MNTIKSLTISHTLLALTGMGGPLRGHSLSLRT
jgi:hypothetical protein